MCVSGSREPKAGMVAEGGLWRRDGPCFPREIEVSLLNEKSKLEEGLQGVWLYNHRSFDAGYTPSWVCGWGCWYRKEKKILGEPCTPDITTQECTRTKKGGSNRHKQNKTGSRGKQQKHVHT